MAESSLAARVAKGGNVRIGRGTLQRSGATAWPQNAQSKEINVFKKFKRYGTARSTAATAALTVLIAVGVLGSVSSAQAADQGGDGDPTQCSSPATFASTPIYGSRGNLAGKQIGEFQLRWDGGSCYANWSRVILFGNTNPSPVTVEQTVESEGHRASSSKQMLDTLPIGATVWTPFIHVVSASSVTCAQVWVSSDFGTSNFHTNGARICA